MVGYTANTAKSPQLSFYKLPNQKTEYLGGLKCMQQPTLILSLSHNDDLSPSVGDSYTLPYFYEVVLVIWHIAYLI